MAVPKRAPRGKGDKRFNDISVDVIAADADDIFITTKSGSSFQVESEAGGTLMEVDDSGDVHIGSLKVSTGAVLPYGSGADILIARLQAAFGDPATLDDGWVGVYKETTSNPDKIYLVTVVADAFWLEEMTAAAAA